MSAGCSAWSPGQPGPGQAPVDEGGLVLDLLQAVPTAPWQHALIDVPALFIAGDRDPNLRTISPAGIAGFLPKLTKSLMLPGCGHWVQQERPADVTAAMLEFLGGLR